MSQHPGKTWSASRLGMWERCQQQFFFRYVEGLKKAPAAAMAMGSAFDGMANDVYEDKIQTGETIQHVDGLWAAHWDQERQKVEDWGNDKPEKILDQGAALSTLWRNDCAVVTKPIIVQPKATINLRDGVAFMGIADLLSDSGVIDLKVKGRRMPDIDVHRSLQLQSYPTLFDVNKFSFHVMLRTKQPSKQIIEVNTSPELDPSLERRVMIADKQMNEAFRSGDFYPNRSHTLCSKKWCAYADQCERANGGIVPD